MKMTKLGKLVLCSLALTAVGQTLPEPGPATFGYTPVESGDNYVVWSRLASRTNDQGGLILQTNTFVQLGNLGGDWPFCCDYTWLIHGECHLSSAYFEPGVVLKFDTNSSLHIDGPLFWPADFNSGGSLPLLTSADDIDPRHGEPLAWASGTPLPGEYGPALVVRAEDLPMATNRLLVLYAQPGIISQEEWQRSTNGMPAANNTGAGAAAAPTSNEQNRFSAIENSATLEAASPCTAVALRPMSALRTRLIRLSFRSQLPLPSRQSPPIQITR